MIVDVYVEHPIYEINQTFSYICPFEVKVGMRVVVPFNHMELVGLVHEVHSDEEKLNFDYELKSVLKVIDEEVLIGDEISKLATYMEHTTIAPYMACIQTMLPTILKPKRGDAHAKRERMVRIKNVKMAFSDKEQECINYVLEHKEVSYTTLRKEFGTYPLKLIKKEALEEFSQEVVSSVGKEYGEYREPELTEEQQSVIERVSSFDGYKPYLLYGVTGSGKTEVYLQLAKKAIEKGKSVIILVPEIGLTPQMVARVKGRFHDLVAIYHSRLNNQERYSEYMRIKRGEVAVVVGTRSAIFMPFENIGLIIVDEEHDKSYKQDNAPHYHARDIALWRGEYHNCPVVMASATPSFESFARAKKGVYELLSLTKRISLAMPEINLVNMREELRSSNPYTLSRSLMDAMKEALARNEQVILLFNRRGYAPTMECKVCHQVVKCPHCDIPLSYHRDSNQMKCHYCDYVAPFIKECPNCHSTKGFTFGGVGIQKLEEDLRTLFPEYRVLRMDRDTTSKKNGHEEIIEKFGNHEADILIGTQMIAKGLDFPNVSVVGIINADQGMNRPDFRSMEDTYDFLSQAAGRCGRADKLGRVFIQTFDETHYLYQFLKDTNYEGFFQREMRYRHVGNYPPYSYMASLTTVDKNEEKAKEFAEAIAQYLKGLDIDGKVYSAAELVKVQDTYRYRVLIRMKDQEALARILDDCVTHFKRDERVHTKLLVDNNPLIV